MVLSEGFRFYPEPIASEEPHLEERVCQGFFLRRGVPLRTHFVLCGRKSSRIVGILGVKDVLSI